MIANVQQSLQLKNAVTAAGIAWALATVHLAAIAAEDVDFPAAPKSQQEVMSARLCSPFECVAHRAGD